LHGVIVVFEGREEESEDDTQTDDLHDAGGEEGWLSTEVYGCSVYEDGICGEEARGFADEGAEFGRGVDGGWDNSFHVVS
jgi:hypothetical protein